MDMETAEFLLSPEGEQLLSTAASLEGDLLARLTALRKKYPPHLASAALEMVELRRRASKKFSRADRMFFTREALEQASSETISLYRSERFSKDSRILDLACGIGGDTIGLASRCFVTAVDSDPIRLAMAERNLAVYDLSDRVKFVEADVTQIHLEADGAFLDPSRRSQGRRFTSLSQISPPLEFIKRLARTAPDSGVKLSPATPDEELDSLGAEIEFISESGECKEAVAWFGGLRSAPGRATILPERATLVTEESGAIPVVEPNSYLYEPDPCVIRAHMVEQVAERLQAGKLDEQIAYLTSETLRQTPFARAYRVLDSMPFNLKRIQQRLREMDAGRLVIKRRGVPFEPEEMGKKLKVSGTRELILVFTRAAGKPWALICTDT